MFATSPGKKTKSLTSKRKSSKHQTFHTKEENNGVALSGNERKCDRNILFLDELIA